MANRRDMARVHARRRHTCPLCGFVARGNGGRASHQRFHIREAELDPNNYASHRKAWQAAYRKLQEIYGR